MTLFAFAALHHRRKNRLNIWTIPFCSQLISFRAMKALIVVALTILHGGMTKKLHELFQKTLLQYHIVEQDNTNGDGMQWSTDSGAETRIRCGNARSANLPVNKRAIIHVDKSSNEICWLHQDTETSEDSTLMPAMLKIDSSILVYFAPPKASKVTFQSVKSSLKQQKAKGAEPLHLSVQLSPFHSKQSNQETADSLLDDLNVMLGSKQRSYVLDSSSSRGTGGSHHRWHAIHRSLTSSSTQPSSSSSSSLHCEHVTINSIIFQSSSSFQLEGIESITRGCLFELVSFLAGQSSVLSLSLQKVPSLMNYEARGRLQSGRPEVEPYGDRGLDGHGQVTLHPLYFPLQPAMNDSYDIQVVGIADSGLYDLSCFFIDDPEVNNHAYTTITTSRSGIVEPDRRKVIQYTAYADAVDDQGGHGSHVAGSVAGHSLNTPTVSSPFSKMNGVAPMAKIAFFDIGMTDKNFLKVPSVSTLLSSAYDVAGARVHTNSWGNLGGLYGAMSNDVDAFLFDDAHADMLVLFAGGNSGEEGVRTINSPANAKNVLTIGATQLRSVFDDRAFADGQACVAEFSSLGPTSDGRLKPDVLSPGDFIMSVWAGSPHNLSASFDPSFHPLLDGANCAVQQMSGTSMATPLAAGTALLLRQYFLDSRFWSAACYSQHAGSRKMTGEEVKEKCKAFSPSGYLLKALFMHSGDAVPRFSDPVFDNVDPTTIASFALGPAPDPFQGYGSILLTNILPLPPASHSHSGSSSSSKGLEAQGLKLHLFDGSDLKLQSFSTVTVTVDLSIAWTEVQLQRKLSDLGIKCNHQHRNLRHEKEEEEKEEEEEDEEESTVEPELKALKVTLAWFDPPHPLGNAKKLLLHDIDLLVQGPNNEFYLGNKPLQSFSREDITGQKVKLDEHNPNEQVLIPHPPCIEGRTECIFTIILRSHALPMKDPQPVAVVITTEGDVSGDPVVLSEEEAVALLPYPDDTTTAGPADSSEADSNEASSSSSEEETFSALLTGSNMIGGQSTRTALNLTSHPNGWALARLDINLSFTNDDSLAGKDSWPSNLELTIVDPHRRAVAVGGVDISIGISHIITEWPSNWMTSADGDYTARIRVLDANLFGHGTWTIIALNSWSQSHAITFNTTVDMIFEARLPLAIATDDDKEVDHDISHEEDDHALPQPTLRPTAAGTDRYLDNFSYPLGKHIRHVTLSFAAVSLDVHAINESDLNCNDPKHMTHPRHSLPSFHQRGVLDRVILRLAGIDPITGEDTIGTAPWLLAVMVTAPNGLIAQVGGLDWTGADDHFYVRRWPDPWLLRDSRGLDWLAERDVHAAGLLSTGYEQYHDDAGERDWASDSSDWWQQHQPARRDESKGQWLVQLAVGYPYGKRAPVSYTGSVTLFFDESESAFYHSFASSNSSESLDGVDSNKVMIMAAMLGLFALWIVTMITMARRLKNYHRSSSSSSSSSSNSSNGSRVNDCSNAMMRERQGSSSSRQQQLQQHGGYELIAQSGSSRGKKTNSGDYGSM